MRTNAWRSLLIAAAAGLTLLAGCVRPQPAARPAAPTDAAVSAVAMLNKTFAVAPFTIPVTDADLLSGYLPRQRDAVSERVPPRLDALLAQTLAASQQRFAAPGVAAACARSASRGDESGRLASMRYWKNVGLCAGADYVVVPMVLSWREREGSDVGATVTASVNMSLYLVDTRTGAIVKHFHFEETQKALADNLLDMPKFVSRHGRWLTAEQLAQEGLSQAMREFGL